MENIKHSLPPTTSAENEVWHESDRPLGDKSAEWLLEHRRNIIDILAWYLLYARDEYWAWLLWHGLNPDEAYRACSILLQSGQAVNPFWEPEPYEPPSRHELSPREVLETVLRFIIYRGIDITASRRDWIVIGSVLKTEYGDTPKGLQLFQSISQFYPNYNRSETARQYKSFRGNYAHGALYNIIKRQGLPDVKTIITNEL